MMKILHRKPKEPMTLIDYSVLQYAGRPPRQLLWKIGMLNVCSACCGFCLVAVGLLTPRMISVLVAGNEIPRLIWVIYVLLCGGGWAFAFMAYLWSRNFVRYVSALVRLNLALEKSIQPANRRERPVFDGYISVMDREP